MEEILSFLDDLQTVTGFVSMLFTGAIWLRIRMTAKQAKEPVKVVLDSGSRQVELPLYLTRQNLSRAEILGRLGMIPMKEKGKRFSLLGISTPAFLKSINDAKEGAVGEIIIPATGEEIDQFDL